MRVFADFHHSSLLRSIIMLFEDRLGYEVFRPVGMEWYERGFWAVYNLPDTAKQYLSLDQAYKPTDGSAPLNQAKISEAANEGIYYCADPGGFETNRGCTMQYFKTHQFDYLIASIPAHVPMFRKLIELYQPQAKLIIQVGNNWQFDVMFPGSNVLASIAPRPDGDCNVLYYHQEFSTEIFHPEPVGRDFKIYSFINAFQQQNPAAWRDFHDLEMRLPEAEFRSYGGQCRDGNMTGALELAAKIREAQFVIHLKETGDGFGHIMYNSFACGRPVITRSSYYSRSLAAELLVPGAFIDLDVLGVTGTKKLLRTLQNEPKVVSDMGAAAFGQFESVVNYPLEAEEVRQWLTTLN